ncbi:kinase-like domain-containing protein [Mycena floridula]|nr:kinase-like domain-containing protein [Mycena floridula]
MLTINQVAVKLLRVFTKQEWDGPRAAKRLRREVAIWKRLNHSNIAKFHGVSYPECLGQRPALVMKWYSNGTAAAYLKDKFLETRISLITDIANGLGYLHCLEPPIVHGDLTGSNVLVNDNGQAVLTDFGLSKVLEDLGADSGNNTTGVLAGSVRWQSPELVLGPKADITVSIESDVWAFGCTAYELYTGKLPYHHRKNDMIVVLDMMHAILPHGGDKNLTGHHTDALFLNIVQQCWEFKPTARPTMNEVLCMWKEFPPH